MFEYHHHKGGHPAPWDHPPPMMRPHDPPPPHWHAHPPPPRSPEPPPAPYYELPAGVMVPLVPVSAYGRQQHYLVKIYAWFSYYPLLLDLILFFYSYSNMVTGRWTQE